MTILDYTIRDYSHRSIGTDISASIGYLLPFAEHWELEMGASANSQLPYLYTYHRDSLPDNRRDLLRSYNSVEQQRGLEGYATILRRFGNFTAKVGLRVGQVDGTYSYISYISDIINGSHANYLIPIPSVHLSYRTPTMHNFSLSYTYRTSAPEASDLMSNIIYHEESYSVGNPDLLPSHTHNLEGGWNKYFDNFGSVGVDVYYKAFTDEHGTLSDVAYSPVFGREVNYTQPFNIGSSHTAGTDLNLTYRPTAMFNVRLNASAVHQAYRCQFRPGEWADDNLWAANLRLSVWAKLWNVLQVFGNIRYTTRQLSFLSRTEPFFTTDLGLSADFFDRHLSLYLNVKDIFDTYSQSTATTNPYLLSNSTRNYSSRYISFGAVIRLGKMELENQARTGGQD